MKKADLVYKLCVFGEGGVGKTTLTRRYITGDYISDTKLTMGADIIVKHFERDDMKISLQIWDFGGEEGYRFLLPAYSKGADAAIFMYDITRLITLEKIDEWLTIFKHGIEGSAEGLPIFLVGGKLDLEEERSASKEYASKMARSRNLNGYFECSSKTGVNIDMIFDYIIHKILIIKGFLPSSKEFETFVTD